MSRILLILLTAVVIGNCKPHSDQIIGIKIYDYKGDYNHLASQWSNMGINTAFISASLAADKNFRQELKARRIKVFLIFPVFQNPEILQKDSSLYAITNTGVKAKEEWVKFVCPSRIAYRNAIKNQLADLVSKFSPDGVSIDFIRQFVYWEKIYPDRGFKTIERACYCDSCLKRFSDINRLVIPDSCETVEDKAIWIDNNFSALWDVYRCDLISSMVKELSEEGREIKKDLLVNVHLVPWRESDFGGAAIKVVAQDLKRITPYADFVSPMCYSQMLKRDPEWISDVVSEMDLRAKGKVLPSIQVYPYYIDRSLSPQEFRQCMEEALKPPSRGVVFFSWPLFEKDSSRMEVVREVLSEN